MREGYRIAVLGAGNIGTSIAKGLVQSGRFSPSRIVLARRRTHLLEEFKNQGFEITDDNLAAVASCDVLLIAVEPQRMNILLDEIAPAVDPERHRVISVVTGVLIRQIEERLGKAVSIVRAMPNTAIAVRESMTCLASNGTDDEALETARAIFNEVGKTLRLREEDMIAATALGACGIAYFLRAIRAASQGGIEVGLSAKNALLMATQTAKGAACLLAANGSHPENEIDKVTTPKGCTILGLNRMEHEGFSSALIRGITVSAEKAATLYSDGKQ
ncbi:MAG TPA: pyrroline-5-carboxylate reductase [Synergistaceae bacterium]|nr:pyrroline-5-carboxylate reductase [Synergistaceae bacterium]